MKQERVYDYRIDNLRAFAIIVVVLGHSIILYSGSWSIYQSDRTSLLFHYVKEVINLFQMPLFFSLSGYLFSKTTTFDSFTCFTIKKIKRLIVPFLSVGLLYMIPLKLLVKYPGFAQVNYFGAVKLFLRGIELGHLWFLPTLFFFFLVSYWIMICFGNHRGAWLLITLVAAIGSFCSLRGYIYINYFFKYYWSFSLGALLGKINIEKISLKVKICVAVGAITLILLSIFNYGGQAIALLASLLIVLLSYFCAPVAKGSQITRSISINSFGIYLFHSPLIYITFTFLLNSSPFIVFVINFFIFGFVSYYLSENLVKTPIKYLLGQWK